MKKYIYLGVGLLAAFMVIAFLPWTTISAGDRGVVLEFGAFKGNVLEPGFHFLSPIKDRVVEMSVQQNSYALENAQSYTKDGQIVDVQTTLIYHVDPKDVGVLYQDVGTDYQNKLIKPIAAELIKNEFGHYTAIEIPANRAKIAANIEPALRERLLANHIIVDDFVYNNEDFKDDYENAIAAKQIEEQNALKAKNVTAQAEESKKQAQLKADSDAYKTQKEVEALKMGGDEYVKKIQAEALKINAEAALKWAEHPVVPNTLTVVGGSDGHMPTIPFLPLK